MPASVTGTEQVTQNLAGAVAGIQARAKLAGDAIAALLESYAKQNHPWQNDTGDTERTTQARITEATDQIITVTLTTGTDYSQFLELCHDGKWAWLWPTLLACKEEILAILTAHLGVKSGARFGLSIAAIEMRSLHV